MSPAVVTIVTPSFNQGEFIRATIESVLAQDYPNIEYVVMDGGSTDQTLSILREYGSRLSWLSERDNGQAHAINKGFQRASGEMVAWLNSDDILLPGAVSAAARTLERIPKVGAIYGEGYRMDGEGRITGRFPATESFNLWKLVHLSDYVLQQATFFRRRAVEHVGWLDESLRYALDWDLLIRLGKRFGLAYTPEYLGVLREHPMAKSFSGGLDRVNEIRRVLERHTGIRYPLGFWTYGLETVHRLWRDWLERHTPGVVGKLLSAPVYLATSAVIMLILRHAQGLYIDGWASDRLKWMLPRGGGEIVLIGTLPDDSRLRRMTLVVTTGNRVIGRWPIASGDFEIRFTVPEALESFDFEVRASQYRRPTIGTELSRRRMAYLFRSADWADTPNR